MKKIVIVGVTGARNRGVEALLVSTIQGLQARFAGASVTIITDDPEFDRWRFAGSAGVSVVPACSFVLGPRITRGLVRLLAWGQARLSGRRRRVLGEVRGANLVVLSGGDMLSNDYSLLSLRRSLDWARLAAAWGVRCVALGQSIGPFRDEAYAALWRAGAEDFSLVTYRESHSRAALQEGGLPLGASAEATADSAFLLPRVEGEERARLLAHYGMREGTRTAVLVPSAGICRYGKQDGVQHVEALVVLARHILAGPADRLLLLPHVSEVKIANDDSLLALEVLRRLGYDARVQLVAAGHTSVEFKTLIAEAEFVVAERMHAAIAGLSTGVPTLVIGYSVKALGILSDTLGHDLGTECLVSIGDFNRLPPDGYLSPFLASGPEIAAALRVRSAELRARAALNFELLESRG